jgi:phage RecT family recombinase
MTHETAVAKRPATVADTVSGWLVKAREEKAHLLPRDVDPDRFWQVITDQLRTNREIAKCTPESVYKACLIAAQYGLEVGVRNMAHIVRYGDHAQLVVGYEGKIWLGVARSKTVKDVNTVQIRLNDFVERTEEGIRFKINPFASEVDRGPVVGYVAIANLTTGGRVEATLTENEYLKRRPKYWERTPHATHRDEMWEKGAVHKLFAKVPLTPDVAATIAASDRVERAVEIEAEVEVRPPEKPKKGVAAVLGKLQPAPEPAPEPEEEPSWVDVPPPAPQEPRVDPGARQRPTGESTSRLPLGRDLEVHRVESGPVFAEMGIQAWDRWTAGRQLAVATAMKAAGISSPSQFWAAVGAWARLLTEEEYGRLASMEDALAAFGEAQGLPGTT